MHTRDAQDKLRLKFGTKVDIVRRGKGGEIRIGFKNEDELIRVFEILSESRAGRARSAARETVAF